jgi:hypothetical protein
MQTTYSEGGAGLKHGVIAIEPLALITVDQTKLDGGLKPEDLASKPSDLNPVITPLK